MADFTALKAEIQNYVKQNGNNAITGDGLQAILISMVQALGDSAINDLASNLSDEALARQGADTTLQGNIDAAVTAITTLATFIGNGYMFRGIATLETVPSALGGKVFYITATAGQYTNMGGITVSEGVSILAYDGTSWSASLLIGIDATPTNGSNGLVRSGGVYTSLTQENARAIAAETSSAEFNSTTKKLIFKNAAGTVLYEMDATPFVIDGMVNDVYISGGNLIISFNTDAGKQDISIPLTAIFNPANYYDKTAINALLLPITTRLAAGYLYMGKATPSGTPDTSVGKVFYLTATAGTYTNYGNLTVNAGITILSYNGSVWSADLLVAIDSTPTQNSTNLITSGGVFAAIKTVSDMLEEGYLYKGIATAATDPSTPSTKVFYIATSAGTYTNFANTQVSEGITILKYDGTNWTKEQVSFLDGGVFDISAYNLSGDPLAPTKYADLEAALGTNGANIPAAIRKGGMSVKFVQSFDNKYVQYRCMAQNFTTDVTQWQGVDDEPAAGSDNLVKSGGVYNTQNIVGGILHDNSIFQNSNYYTTPYIPFGGGQSIWNVSEINNSAYIEFYDSELNRVNQNPASQNVVQRDNAPSTYAYIRCCFKLNGIGSLVLNGKTVWDNSKITFANVKERMANDNALFTLQSRFDYLLNNGYVFGGVVSSSSSPKVVTDNKIGFFYLCGIGGQYNNFPDYEGNPLVIPENTVGIIRDMQYAGVSTGRFVFDSITHVISTNELYSSIARNNTDFLDLIEDGVSMPSAEDAQIGFLATNSGKWTIFEEPNYRYVLVYIGGLSGYKITAVPGGVTRRPGYAFFKTYNSSTDFELVEGGGFVADYPNNVTIPEDATYLLLDVSNTNDSYVSTPILPKDIIIHGFYSINDNRNSLKEKQDVIYENTEAGIEISDIASGEHIIKIQAKRVNLLDPICKQYLYFSGSAGSYSIVSSGSLNANYIEVEEGKSYRIGGDLSGFNSSVFRYGFTTEVPAPNMSTLSSGAVQSGTVITAPAGAKYLLWTTGSSSVRVISSNAILSEGTSEIAYTPYIDNLSSLSIVVADDVELTNQETVPLNSDGKAVAASRYPTIYVQELTGVNITIDYPVDLEKYIGTHAGGDSNYISYSAQNQSLRVGIGANTLPGSSISVGRNNLTRATGIKNISIGNDNMEDTTGDENVSVGYHAGFRNTEGAHNTFVGSEAGDDNTLGRQNVSVGSHALQRNNKGHANVALGYRALLGGFTDYVSGGGNRDTGYNVAIGYDAAQQLVGGYTNVAIGAESMKLQTASIHNVALGAGALSGQTQVSGCVAIGVEAGKQADGNNQLWIANSDVDKEHALIYGEFNSADIVKALLRLNAGKILMPNLPTTDPQVAGQLWNDNGTLKISSGS